MPPNQHHTEYAPPVLRAPSPASSVGTEYGADQTSFSDGETQLSQFAFERKWEERLELGLPRKEEERANQDPLLPRLPRTAAEEQELHKAIMLSLENEVKRLEENELFEQTFLKESQAASEQQPTTDDIDVLMRSMMMGATANPNIKGSKQSNRVNGHSNITNGPWNNNGLTSLLDGMTGMDSVHTSGGTTGSKRSRNGTSRKG